MKKSKKATKAVKKAKTPKIYTLDNLPAFKRSEARFNALTPTEQEAKMADVLRQIKEC